MAFYIILLWQITEVGSTTASINGDISTMLAEKTKASQESKLGAYTDHTPQKRQEMKETNGMLRLTTAKLKVTRAKLKVQNGGMSGEQ